MVTKVMRSRRMVGRYIGGQQLCGDLPLQDYRHDHQLLTFEQGQILDCEHGQVSVLWQKISKFPWNPLIVHHLHLFEHVFKSYSKIKKTSSVSNCTVLLASLATVIMILHSWDQIGLLI